MEAKLNNPAWLTILFIEFGLLVAGLFWISIQLRKGPDNGGWSTRRLTILATTALVVGISPILSSLLADWIAHSAGCYFGEFSIYSRSGTVDFSDDMPGCRIGQWNVAAPLIAMHVWVFGIFLTWPLVILAVAVLVAVGARLFKPR